MEEILPFESFPEDYERFLNSLSTETWRQGILVELARASPRVKHIFDAGAGTGIGARLMRSLGDLSIVGADSSRQMLARAEGLYDKTVLADLSNLPDMDTRFDAIVSAFDTLNYLSAPQLLRFFDWVSGHLAVQGLLIFDYSSPALLQEAWQAKKFSELDQETQRRLEWDISFLPEIAQSKITLTVVNSDGALQWTEDHFQFAFDQFEIHRIAKAAGLCIERVRDLQREMFSPDAHTHVFVLRRQSKNELK